MDGEYKFGIFSPKFGNPNIAKYLLSCLWFNFEHEKMKVVFGNNILSSV